jgi:pimeloyl-ACP methyl ester carboxylesterase
MRKAAAAALFLWICGRPYAQESSTDPASLDPGDAIESHSGSSGFHPDPGTDTFFFVDRGAGLDTGCTYRSRGPLAFEIEITRHVGETDSEGYLREPQKLIDNGVISPTARIRMPVFDVDYDAAVAGARQPERDRVTINGVNYGFLTGANAVWKLNEFEIPIRFVKFARRSVPADQGPNRYGPGSPPIPGRNTIRIDIDTANTTESWCTSVDWASLSFEAMAPLALIHGTNAQSSSWEVQAFGTFGSPLEFLRERGVPFEYRIDMEANGSAETNAQLLSQNLNAIARSWGVQSFHLVAHSKGATDSRAYLQLYYPADKERFRVLSLYSLGTPSRGTALSDYSVLVRQWGAPLDERTLFLDEVVFTGLTDGYLGSWLAIPGLAPSDPALSLQTTWGMEEFNRKYKKQPGVCYYSLAGDADTNGNKTIEAAEAVPLIPLSSVTGSLLGNRIYRVLGRTLYVTIQERPIRLGLSTYQRLTAILAPTLEPNDLTSRVDSVHCEPCGFQRFTRGAALNGIYLYNHSALKNPTTMLDILQQIARDTAESPTARQERCQ